MSVKIEFECKNCGTWRAVDRATDQATPKFCGRHCVDAYARRPREITKRFWLKVDIRGDNSCWLWKEGLDKKGYGQFQYRLQESKQRVTRASRFAYLITHKHIPRGMHVLHTCDVPACCNPGHLYLGTNEQNIEDKMLRSRQSRGEHRPMAKLRDVDIPIIRKMLSQGYTQQAISRHFGVSQQRISKVKLGVLWKHVPEEGQ